MNVERMRKYEMVGEGLARYFTDMGYTKCSHSHKHSLTLVASQTQNIIWLNTKSVSIMVLRNLSWRMVFAVVAGVRTAVYTSIE